MHRSRLVILRIDPNQLFILFHCRHMKTVSGSYFSFSNLCFEPSYSTNGLALRILYDKNKSASLNEKERERERACVSEKESEYLYQKECM